MKYARSCPHFSQSAWVAWTLFHWSSPPRTSSMAFCWRGMSWKMDSETPYCGWGGSGGGGDGVRRGGGRVEGRQGGLGPSSEDAASMLVARIGEQVIFNGTDRLTS